MASLPYIQLYVGDYLKDTMHLSTLEHGAYMLLIMNYWTSANALRTQSERLAAITKMSVEEFEKIKPVLSEFFIEKDGFWIHPRIEEDLIKAESKSKKASASAKIKSANAVRTQCERSAISSSASMSSSDIKKINKKDLLERDASEVFSYWISKSTDSHSDIFDNSRKRAILKMLEFFSVDNLKLAIDGCALDPFYNGEKGVRIDSVEIIFKNATNVEKFITLAKNPSAVVAKPTDNKYESFMAETKDDNVDNFVEILKRAESENRYDLTLDEVKMYHKHLKGFCLTAISGAFDDFQVRRTPYDGKFPKPKILIDYALHREKDLKRVAESEYSEIVRWVSNKWEVSGLRPGRSRVIMIENEEMRKQLPENLEDFAFNEKAKEKFIELFLKIEESTK